ncbi:hypothetical protein AVEN_240881-1 [Araneus ventricosus]|uniref:Uncharacterized protein n=1 Tax=Araneus ventricosus TaxID=182803 RepID=A0A4Y2M6P0_ARAVE|nr:hypothetical protein AVEN_240881-1 [Araneus ventricosus]
MLGLELWMIIRSAHTFCHSDWTEEHTSHFYNRYCQSYFNLLQPTYKHVCGSSSSTTEHHPISAWMCGALWALNSQGDWSGWAHKLAGILTRSLLSGLFLVGPFEKSGLRKPLRLRRGRSCQDFCCCRHRPKNAGCV